ncbi:MAG: hypothetical protein ACXVEF_29065 [Polyangiales bacterium]
MARSRSEEASLDRAVTVALVLIAVLSSAELAYGIVRRDALSVSLATLLLLIALAPLASDTRAWLNRRS